MSEDEDRDCDELFLEKFTAQWRLNRCVDTSAVPRLIAIARRCQSVLRIEEENEWLRQRMDKIVSTDLERL